MNESLSSIIKNEEYEWFCVGSLPFVDAYDAASFVLARPWIIPFIPELPKRSASELMLNKGLRALEPGWNGYQEDELSALSELIRAVEGRFVLPLLKFSVVGPATLARFGLEDESLSDDLQKCIEATIKQMRFLVNATKAISRANLLVLDEPCLHEWSQYSTNARGKIVEAWEKIIRATQEMNVSIGLHSCAAFSLEFLENEFNIFSWDVNATAGTDSLLCSQATELNSKNLHAVLAPGCFSTLSPSDPLAAYENALRRHQVIKTTLHSETTLLKAAGCGHAFASLDWVDMLYQQ